MKYRNIIRAICGLICVNLWFVICGFCYATTKNDLTSLFYSANILYEQGKYEEAASEYKKILDTGYQSGPLYYNIGNCYFKLGHLGKTILYYERAKRLIPQDPELKFNYNYVQSLLKDKINIPRKNWIVRRFLNITEFLTFSKWLEFNITIWLILIISLIFNMFTNIFRKILKYIIIGALVVLISGILCATAQFNKYSSRTAVVLSKEVPVRYGPGEAEVEAFLLHEGTKVEIKNEGENWFQIRLPDGKSGWLEKESVECI